MKKIFGALLMLVLLPVSSSAAEKINPVDVTAKVLKSKIKIGDELRFLVQVEHPRKFTVTPPPEKTDLSPFEIKQMDASPLKKGQNRVQETYGFTLTVFEIGELKIPSMTIRYEDESGKPGEVRTEPVLVTVVSVGKKLTDKDDIRPIKGPMSVSLLRFRTWVFAILAGILSVFLGVKIVRRWIQYRKDLESRKPAHVRLRLELKRLKDLGLLEDKKVKEYYSALSDILRNYMDRSWKLQSHEHTTAEILELLKAKNFDKSVTDKIKTVLEETDLVKFAKKVPERALADRLESDILEVVDQTKPSETDKKRDSPTRCIFCSWSPRCSWPFFTSITASGAKPCCVFPVWSSSKSPEAASFLSAA